MLRMAVSIRLKRLLLVGEFQCSVFLDILKIRLYNSLVLLRKIIDVSAL